VFAVLRIDAKAFEVLVATGAKPLEPENEDVVLLGGV
jgi:hypothetical protein